MESAYFIGRFFFIFAKMKIQIISDPHGYIDEKHNGYEKELIIEV